MNISEIGQKYFSERVLPSSSFWPQSITLESSITSRLKDLSRYTNKEPFFAKKSGAVGWEYGLSILFVADSVYISQVYSGNYSSVGIKSTYEIKPVQVDSAKVKLDITFGDKKFSSKPYPLEQLSSGIINGVVATFHTHPKFYHSANVTQFTFFSLTDINSLIISSVPIMGLIAGNYVWLACKTSSSKLVPDILLNQATRIELEKGNEGLKEFVKENLLNFGIVFYFGSIAGKLERV